MSRSDKKTQSKKALNYDFFFLTEDPSYLPQNIEYHQENPTQGLMGFFPNEEVDDPRLTATEAFTFMRLYSLMQKQGYAWASNKFLSKITRTTERQVRRILKKLRDLNFIKTVGIRYKNKEYRRIYVPFKFQEFIAGYQYPPPNSLNSLNFPYNSINQEDKLNFSSKLKNNLGRTYMTKLGGHGGPTYLDNINNKSISKDIQKDEKQACSQKKELSKEVQELTAKFKEKVLPLNLSGKIFDEEKEGKAFDLLTRKDQADISEISQVMDWLYEKSWYKENGVLPLTAKGFRSKYPQYRQKYLATQNHPKNEERQKELNAQEAENRSLAYRVQHKSKAIEVTEKWVIYKATRDSLSYRMNPKIFRETILKWAALKENRVEKPNQTCSETLNKALQEIKTRNKL